MVRQIVFFMLLLPIVANAATVKIGGIWYNLENGYTAIVVRPEGDETYSGDIVIPDNIGIPGDTEQYRVTKIEQYAFENCENLVSVVIPNSVKTLGEGVFRNCKCLKKVTIGNGLCSVNYETFHNCSSLDSVVFGENISYIDGLSFCDCSSLTSITLPEGLISIGESAFSGCSKLTNVTIPNNVTTIGYGAFSGCQSLLDISIPNSVTTIGEGAFYCCSSLTSVAVPNSLTNMGSGIFRECTGLTSISIDSADTGVWTFFGCSGLRSVKFGSNVQRIGEGSFQNCTDLVSLSFTDGIKSIGSGAFQNCKSLQSVLIPDNVTEIGDFAFKGCSSLLSASIGNGITHIGDAFPYCDELHTVTFGKAITRIYSFCFFMSPKLTDVYCYAVVPPLITPAEDVFIYANCHNGTLYVPESSIEAYRAEKAWNQFGNIVGLSHIGIQNVLADNQNVKYSYQDGILTICTQSGEIPVSIFDINGQQLASFTVSTDETRIAVSNVDSSAVILKMGNKSVKVIVR